MGITKEFGQRLAQIRQSEITLIEVQAKEKERAEFLKKERELKYSQEQPLRIQKLEQEAKELFRPLLEAVNESYLEKRGEISQNIDKDGFSLVVELNWDKKEDGGNRLVLHRYYNLDVVLGLHGSLVSGPRFDMKDPDCVNKIQEGIMEALTKGETRWFTASGGRCDSLEGAF